MADKNPCLPADTAPRALTVTVSPQLLEKVLGLPPDVRITGARHDSISQVITLRLDAPDFPIVFEGAHPMRAILTYDSKTKKSSIG